MITSIIECKKYKYQQHDILKFIKFNLFDTDYYTTSVNVFFETIHYSITYKILCAQIILSGYKGVDPDLEFTESVLSTVTAWCVDDTLDYNLRADAADLILNYMTPTDGRYQIAQDVILFLGRNDNTDGGFYTNSQNVHDTSVSDSCDHTINFLFSSENFINTESFDQLKIRILDSRPDLELCMSRIELDHNVYGKCRKQMSVVFTRLLNYIDKHEYKNVLTERLYQEMEEMQHTCSTGYISRLMNVLSGIVEDMGIKMSYTHQIQARFKKCIETYALDDPDCDDILEQFVSTTIGTKQALLAFIRKNVPNIRQDMYQEFKMYISDQEFDTSFNMALVSIMGI
jgi:predicted house-cleaning noncanonical NTP pyrophosphatase (MazG superfamily)